MLEWEVPYLESRLGAQRREERSENKIERRNWEAKNGSARKRRGKNE